MFLHLCVGPRLCLSSTRGNRDEEIDVLTIHFALTAFSRTQLHCEHKRTTSHVSASLRSNFTVLGEPTRSAAYVFVTSLLKNGSAGTLHCLYNYFYVQFARGELQMSITVREISTKKDKKKFFKFLIDMYCKNPHAAPNLYSDEMSEFDPQTNDAFRFCECKMFLAYRDNKIVGRIAGIWHKYVNEKNGTKQLRFTRFDVLDDFEITKALFAKLVEWAKQLGMDEIIGPMSFSDLNEEGMLIQGFDRDSTYIEIYNHPYYVTHMEKLGAYKVVDWNCYRIKVPETHDERLTRIAQHVAKRNNYEVVDLNAIKKDKAATKQLFVECMEVLDIAFRDLYGTSPINRKQMEREADALLQVYLPELACAVKQNGKVVCYGFCMPCINEAMRKGKGNIIPFGLIPFIKALSKPKVAEMMSIGVLPEHKNLGAVSLVMDEVLRGTQKLGVEYLETGPELEENHQVQNLWKNYDRELVKRHRCWGMKVADLEKLLNK